MNILFVTPESVESLCGGIARITYLLASEFKKRGYICVSAFRKVKSDKQIGDDIFSEEILLNDGAHVLQYSEVLEKHNIQYVIVQGGAASMNQETVYLREAIELQSRKILVYFVFHSMPGYELNRLDWSILLKRIFSKSWKQNIKQLFIQTLLPVNKSILQKQLQKKYGVPYQMADKVVLLSPSYIDDFNYLACGHDTKKYVAIPNMLTYPATDNIPSSKKKEVLIVARMDDYSKRIKMALQIWEKMPCRILNEGWHLVIVGDGEDLSYYQKYVQSREIKNVWFEGQKNPLPYYQDASIFMMTSSIEGWPMTLMEAMQNGCVPIAFDNFKAVYDIIDNDKDGVIVSNDNIQIYAEKLDCLMCEEAHREQMAQAGIKKCQKFSQEKVIQQWLAIL